MYKAEVGRAVTDAAWSILQTDMVRQRHTQAQKCKTHPPLFTPTRFSFSTAIETSSPFVMRLLEPSAVEMSSLSFTARKASVEATTMAALEERPEPAGTEPVTSMSVLTGSGFLRWHL